MTKQTINFGTPPLGIGGDTYKAALEKCNANFTELYSVMDTGIGLKNGQAPTTMSAAELNDPTKWRSGVFRYSDSTLPETYGHIKRFGGGTSGTNGGWFVDIAYTSSGAVHLRYKTNGTSFGAWVQQANVNSNVASASKLQTARTIGGVSFNGTANISLPGVNTAGNQNTSGNAASATKLATARTINGTSFDGSANITTANWGTARTLTIGDSGKSVNGSGNVSWSRSDMGVPRMTTTTSVGIDNAESCIGYITNTLLGATDGALYSQVYSDIWKHQIQGDYRTGQIAVRGKNNGTWQAWRTVLDSSNYNNYSPTKTGTGASGTWGIAVTGNAGSATKLATARTIGGVSFNGTANINLPGVNTAGNQNTSGNAATATTLQTARTIAISGAVTGTATSFDGSANITIATTAIDGSKISTGTIPAARIPTLNQATSGNAASATKLQTARTINGVSFNGTANITVADSTKLPMTGGTLSGNLSATALGVNNNSNSSGVGVSLYTGATAGMPQYGLAFSGTATFGTHGSVTGDWATYFTMGGATNRGWIFKTGNAAGGNVASISATGIVTAPTFSGALSGNASTATKLQTPVKINGIDFDGSQNINLPLTGAKKVSIACNLEYPTFQPSKHTSNTYFRTTDVWNEINFQTIVTADLPTLRSYTGTIKRITTSLLPAIKGSSYTGRVLFVSHDDLGQNSGSNNPRYVFTLRFLDLDPAYSTGPRGTSIGSTAQLFRFLPDITNIPEFSSFVANNTMLGDYTFTFTKPFIGEYVAVACATNATAGTESIVLTKSAGNIRVVSYVGGTGSDTLKISLILIGEQQA